MRRPDSLPDHPFPAIQNGTLPLVEAPSPGSASRPCRTVVRLALSPGEAAAALGISRSSFDLHVGPELKWVRRGRLKFVSVRELERWLEVSAARTLDAA